MKQAVQEYNKKPSLTPFNQKVRIKTRTRGTWYYSNHYNLTPTVILKTIKAE